MAPSLFQRLRGLPTSDGIAIEHPEPSAPVAPDAEKGFESKSAAATGVADASVSRRLQMYERAHRWDANLEGDYLEEISAANGLHDADAEAEMISRVLDNSPYPEVRAAVRNFDEDVPANTVRAWAIGMLLNTVGSALNSLFSMHQPSVLIGPTVVLLVAYPIAWFWNLIMPSRVWNTFGYQWSLNPGPFNLKEHCLIVIMANASFGSGSAYFTDVLLAMRKWYHQNLGAGWEVLFALSTQLTGFSIAGFMRRWLVEPSSMIWPQNLVMTSFMYALHDKSPTDPTTSNGWTVSRFRYFFYVFVGSFVWYWFPGLIAPFLSVFAWVTWIKPQNALINQLFGGSTGLSLIPITFDWQQISGYVSSPLMVPFHAIGNTLFGTVFWYIIVTSAIHFSGRFYANYLPISDQNTYDRFAQPYNVTKILTPQYTLDVNKYKEYSPLYMSTTFILSYGLSFASLAAVIIHTVLIHGPEIMVMVRATRGELDDIHMRMMRKYRAVPGWWYGVLFVIVLAFCFICTLAWDTNLTWWALIVALCIPLVFSIPVGLVQGATNIQLGLNVLTEFMVGYMLPGRPLGMMMFKTYGYITMTQALSFVQDIKLGYYMKVPPRTLFMGQLVATFWGALVQLGVILWGMSAIKDVCSPDQPSGYTCPNGRVFFNASVIWGLIGPSRLFSVGRPFGSIEWFWLAGALLPIIAYLVAIKWPRSVMRYFNAPIFFGGMGNLPPATPMTYLTWCVIGTIFNKWIRNKWRGWWMRFNYVTSGALDCGMAVSMIVIFFCIDLSGAQFPTWWGNGKSQQTMDLTDTAVLHPLKPGESFGPSTWN